LHERFGIDEKREGTGGTRERGKSSRNVAREQGDAYHFYEMHNDIGRNRCAGERGVLVEQGVDRKIASEKKNVKHGTRFLKC